VADARHVWRKGATGRRVGASVNEEREAGDLDRKPVGEAAENRGTVLLVRKRGRKEVSVTGERYGGQS
jgi:hypothetical protein